MVRYGLKLAVCETERGARASWGWLYKDVTHDRSFAPQWTTAMRLGAGRKDERTCESILRRPSSYQYLRRQTMDEEMLLNCQAILLLLTNESKRIKLCFVIVRLMPP